MDQLYQIMSFEHMFCCIYFDLEHLTFQHLNHHVEICFLDPGSLIAINLVTVGIENVRTNFFNLCVKGDGGLHER